MAIVCLVIYSGQYVCSVYITCVRNVFEIDASCMAAAIAVTDWMEILPLNGLFTIK